MESRLSNKNNHQLYFKLMKKVSVIIPFYSHLDWLYEAMESVFAQTYQNYEAILVNDGSKEDMTDFLNKYGDRITYLYQENAGPAVARNNGIRHVTGDYIAFLDSDDVWMPEKLEKQVSFMEASGAMWSHTGFFYWTPEEESLQKVDNSFNYGWVHEQCAIHFSIATPSVMINRIALTEHPNIKFPENYRIGEDSSVYRMLSLYYPLGFVEDPLLKVRLRGSNAGRQAMVRLKFSDQMNQKRIAGEEGFDVSDRPIVAMLKYNSWGYKAISSLKISDNLKEILAKTYWLPAFIFERLYSKKFHSKTEEEDRYILRNSLMNNEINGGV